ncbi:hypothetical protein [Kocuria rhizophila]|uniref:hypothetical protein n=1 Tax=Kocuria rhizophila TaxID=72000 RepID=UPI0034DB7C04
MGLRDLFRSTKHDTPTPEPSPGARPTAPGPEDGAGRQPHEAAQQTAPGEAAPRRRPEPASEPLPEDGALHHLVELLLSRGADRARLTLVQSGNIMTHQTRQAVGEAQDEVENGTVDQGSPLFDDVADLYTQAMSTPVGPWRQLDLVVAAPEDGLREITVSYDFPNGESRTEHYSHGRARSGDSQDRHGVPGTTEHARDGQPVEHAPAEQASESHPGTGVGAAALAGGAAGGLAGAGHSRTDEHGTVGEAGAHDGTASTQGTVAHDAPATDDAAMDHAAADDASAAPTEAEDSVRVVEDGHAEPAEDGDVLTAGTTEPVAAHDASAAQPSTGQESAGTVAAPESAELAFDAQDGRFPEDAELGAEDDARFEQGLGEDPRVAEDAPAGQVHEEQHAPEGSDELPAHVDESAFGADAQDPLLPAQAGVSGDDDPSGAPQLATATDVSPSYRAPAQEQDADPNALATGNLVLSVGDVTARLSDAQRHLFGEDGTARDVSTVLIRVRALGTYYDALTHVRLNGFWDQRPTFELVPEEQLKVQELKDDSYVEGSGAPLAMMFRFRPGVPPEVAFDYSDEEAFVRYEQRLPGQNYLEELRMYPRTGSNIPRHVNDALQDWNY